MHEIIEANSHILDVNDFRTALLKWGREHFRPLPWRLSEDPYHTLAAELMLHRTQAPQVVPVYERFLRSYPSLPALGAASLEQLHQILYPLGLRWRIDLIHKMVADLITRFDGQVPCEKHELLSLPGVSDYIASAVRCFAWNLPEALIDTNTVRI